MKWKEYLLKTSLPLELMVAEELGRKKWWIGGEYSYIRDDINSDETEFSVDLHASRFIDSTCLPSAASYDILVECKYCSPGVKWIFMPYPSGSDMVIGSIWITEALSISRILSLGPLLSIDNQLDYCIKGVQIFDNGSDRNSIKRGLSQLRYGMSNLVGSRMHSQLHAWHDEEARIQLTSSVLVTTAPLFVLKHEVSLEAIKESDQLEDFADPVDALIVLQPTSEKHRQYTDKLADTLFPVSRKLRRRTEMLGSVLSETDYPKYLYPTEHKALSSIREASERTIVVNYNSLGKIISDLYSSAEASMRDVLHFAQLELNKETMIPTIKSRSMSA